MMHIIMNNKNPSMLGFHMKDQLTNRTYKLQATWLGFQSQTIIKLQIKQIKITNQATMNRQL